MEIPVIYTNFIFRATNLDCKPNIKNARDKVTEYDPLGLYMESPEFLSVINEFIFFFHNNAHWVYLFSNLSHND